MGPWPCAVGSRASARYGLWRLSAFGVSLGSKAAVHQKLFVHAEREHIQCVWALDSCVVNTLGDDEV